MRFLESFRRNRVEQKIAGTEVTFGELMKLHPDYRNGESNYWVFNRIPSSHGTMKVRFGFDDPKLLNGSSFHSKIGANIDKAVPHRYIGFSYGKEGDREQLEAWAKKFPWSELIENLDRKGVITEQSKVTHLNG